MNQDTDLFTKNKNNKSTSISYGRMLWGLLLPFIFITVSLTIPLKSVYAVPVLTILFFIGFYTKSNPKLGNLYELVPKINTIPSNISELKNWFVENQIVVLFVYFVVVIASSIISVWYVAGYFGVTSFTFSPILIFFFNSHSIIAGLGLYHGLKKNNTIISGVKYSILFLTSTTILTILYALLLGVVLT